MSGAFFYNEFFLISPYQLLDSNLDLRKCSTLRVNINKTCASLQALYRTFRADRRHSRICGLIGEFDQMERDLQAAAANVDAILHAEIVLVNRTTRNTPKL